MAQPLFKRVKGAFTCFVRKTREAQFRKGDLPTGFFNSDHPRRILIHGNGKILKITPHDESNSCWINIRVGANDEGPPRSVRPFYFSKGDNLRAIRHDALRFRDELVEDASQPSATKMAPDNNSRRLLLHGNGNF